MDDVETCDPVWQSYDYGSVQTDETGDTAHVVLSRMTFTSTGWRDCAHNGVECRIVVARAAGGFGRSRVLTFEPGPVERTRSEITIDPAVIRGSADAVLRFDGEPDPTWSEDVPDDLWPFAVSTCVFRSRTLSNDCDITWDADRPVIEDGRVSIPVGL